MNRLEPFKQFATKSEKYSERKNAIIYTRVSTKEQAETNTSLETQKKLCEQYAKNNNYIVKAYFGGTYESAKSDDTTKLHNTATKSRSQRRGEHTININLLLLAV